MPERLFHGGASVLDRAVLFTFSERRRLRRERGEADRDDTELACCIEQPVTVMAWGAFAPRTRATTVAQLLWDTYTRNPGAGRLAVLGWTASRMPRHPLYVSAATQPEYCDEAQVFDA